MSWMSWSQKIEFLLARGWTVECESPFEIHHEETGGFATGYAAELVIERLMEKEEEDDSECN
jgi:hypothetical protein